MKIKALSLLLAICLMVGLLPVMTANAETTVTTAPTTAATTAATTKPAATTPTPAVTSPTVTQPATTAPTTTVPTTSAPTDATNPNFDSVSLSVKLCENSTTQDYSAILTVTKGGKAVYATTNDSGTPALVKGDAVPNNRYIKFEYPQNGLPTITLMNAKLRSTGNALDLSSFDAPVKIIIAGDSTIESTNKNGIYRASYGDITICGPAKLTMNCYNSAIAFSADPYTNSLTLKDLKLKATAYANADGHTLQIPAGNLTVDKSTLELVNRAGVCVYLGFGNVSGYGSASISNSVFSATSQNTAFKLAGNLAIFDSNVQFSSDTQALLCGKNLSVNGSTLYLTGRSNAKETMDVRGDFTLHTSNAEIIGTRFAIFSATTLPRTIGEYTAVAGITKESSVSFNENLIGAYQYYYAESLEQPTEPTEPTVSDTTPTEGTSVESDPTLAPIEPTGDSEITFATLPAPTRPVNSTAKKSGTMFWILAVLMVLGAGGAVVMAIRMFRRCAEDDYEDEFAVDFEEILAEESAEAKKFSWENIKKVFVRQHKENILEEDVPEEASEAETKKFSWEKILKFFTQKHKETLPVEAEEDFEEELMKKILEEPLPIVDEDELDAIIKEFRDVPAAAVEEDSVEMSTEDSTEYPQEDTMEAFEEVTNEVPEENTAEEPHEEMVEVSAENTAEKPKKFSTEKLKKFFIRIIEETTADDSEETAEEDTEN